MAQEVLLFLPGMMCDARMFAPQMAYFADQYLCEVAHLTRPSIAEMARGLLAEAQGEKLNLIGLSMGGIVAMEMAAQAPQRVVRLALLDTNHLADAADRYEIRNQWNDDVRDGLLKSIIIDWMKPTYLAKANRHKQHLLDLFVDMAMDLGPDVFVHQNLALRDRADQTKTLAQYAGPALVMCGEEDMMCPPARHEQMAQLLSRSTLAFVPDAGHISTLENPDFVNKALKAWLARSV